MSPPRLPLDAGTAAVRLARAAAEAEVLRSRARLPSPGGLDEPRGAFVTVWGDGGGLRGCVGDPEPQGPLRGVVASAARSAVRDPRFDPVRPSELPRLRLEVSVLTPPRPLAVADPERLPDSIRVGEHGLLLHAGRRRGLLLPQVAVEHGFTAEAFLAACCTKAGLRPDAWRARDGLAWHVFEAQVFEELEPRGPVGARGEERPELA